MGVDIYGRRTQWTGTKPEIDWTKEHSSEAKDEFFRLADEFEDNNPGYYFRSNWWGWRPIVMLSEIAAQNSDLEIDFKYWGANDGKGLENQEECTELANALDELLEADGSFEHETDELYVNMGSWRDGSGMLVEPELQDQLNDELPYGKVTFTGIMLPDSSKIYYPSHSCDKAHIDRFIKFLHECGGFKIW